MQILIVDPRLITSKCIEPLLCDQQAEMPHMRNYYNNEMKLRIDHIQKPIPLDR